MSTIKYMNKKSRYTVINCDHFTYSYTRYTVTYHRFPQTRDRLVYYLTLIWTLFNILFLKFKNLNLIIFTIKIN